MTKPKLSDAIKSSATTQETVDQSVTEQVIGSADATPVEGDAEADGDDSEAEESADDSPESDAAASTEVVSDPAGSSKTVADFRAAFGHEQGSVFFVDGVSFEDACTTHMVTLNAKITSQAEEIAALKAVNADLAKEIHGERDPLELGAEEISAEQKDRSEKIGDAKAAYAEGLKAKGSSR